MRSRLEPGEELFIDYGLVIDGEISDDVRAQYACHCGASICRQSMIGGNATSR
jgi:SET domain-containing protein